MKIQMIKVVSLLVVLLAVGCGKKEGVQKQMPEENTNTNSGAVSAGPKHLQRFYYKEVGGPSEGEKTKFSLIAGAPELQTHFSDDVKAGIELKIYENGNYSFNYFELRGAPLHTFGIAFSVPGKWKMDDLGLINFSEIGVIGQVSPAPGNTMILTFSKDVRIKELDTKQLTITYRSYKAAPTPYNDPPVDVVFGP